MTAPARLADPSRHISTERELVLAAQHHPERRGELVEAFLPLIGSVARIYRGSPAVGHSELMQDGVVGLLRALERYDPTRGTPFWAYASWWVRQAMQQLVAELTWPVVLSDRALRQLARVKEAERQHVRRFGEEPTLQSLCSASGMRRPHVQQLLAAARRARGLDEPLSGDGGRSGTFADFLADPRAQDGYDEVPLHAQVDELPRLLSELSERERAIVRARYGLDGREHTLSDLGRRLGVSAERVRLIEQAALAKMGDALAPGAPDRLNGGAARRDRRAARPQRPRSSARSPGAASARPASVSTRRGLRSPAA
jgi:RNA polymerase sigma factor (sigma-70 family)